LIALNRAESCALRDSEQVTPEILSESRWAASGRREENHQAERLEAILDVFALACGGFDVARNLDASIDRLVELTDILDGAHEFAPDASVVQEDATAARTSNTLGSPSVDGAFVFVEAESDFGSISERHELFGIQHDGCDLWQQKDQRVLELTRGNGDFLTG
jgi:hypothetical protein